MKTATHILRAGWGANTSSGSFWRATEDTPVCLAPAEYAKANHVIVYRVSDDMRLHVRRDSLTEVRP